MKYTIAALVVVAILLAPAVQAYGSVDSCFNATHLLKEAVIEISDVTYTINQTMYCAYGCDDVRDQCKPYYGTNESYPMPLGVFLFFEGLSIIIFMVVIYRIDVSDRETKIMDIVLPLLCVVMLSSLALQSHNVIDTVSREAMQLTMAIWVNYAFAIVSLALFFFMLFKYIKSVIKEGY